MEQLPALELLWVGKNKIAKLENLSPLKNLTLLSIQSNRIIKMEGLEELLNLEELYMSHNGIQKIEGLEKNVRGFISARESLLLLTNYDFLVETSRSRHRM